LLVAFPIATSNSVDCVPELVKAGHFVAKKGWHIAFPVISKLSTLREPSVSSRTMVDMMFEAMSLEKLPADDKQRSQLVIQFCEEAAKYSLDRTYIITRATKLHLFKSPKYLTQLVTHLFGSVHGAVEATATSAVLILLNEHVRGSLLELLGSYNSIWNIAAFRTHASLLTHFTTELNLIQPESILQALDSPQFDFEALNPKMRPVLEKCITLAILEASGDDPAGVIELTNRMFFAEPSRDKLTIRILEALLERFFPASAPPASITSLRTSAQSDANLLNASQLLKIVNKYSIYLRLFTLLASIRSTKVASTSIQRLIEIVDDAKAVLKSAVGHISQCTLLMSDALELSADPTKEVLVKLFAVRISFALLSACSTYPLFLDSHKSMLELKLP